MKLFINPGSSRSVGQAVLLSKNITIIEHRVLIKGRLQTLRCNINNCIITIANVYASNSDNDRKTFFEVLVELLVLYDYGDRIIMRGYFNITLEKEDTFGGLKVSQKAVKYSKK